MRKQAASQARFSNQKALSHQDRLSNAPHCSRETTVFLPYFWKGDEKPMIPFINGGTGEKQD
ncbi:hypothetical protein [Geobacillus sp. C56-T2]|uniref:hypothetical protein n=1 Tax=Geobacillus sp. C56-T2 TaxID=600773 RepID=UPI0011A910F8|nr:hypothetical protein [Geobacillus sp. C56-T2]NNV06605.1 hypothetical protein [Geobacillus sp. MMMUD3]